MRASVHAQSVSGVMHNPHVGFGTRFDGPADSLVGSPGDHHAPVGRRTEELPRRGISTERSLACSNRVNVVPGSRQPSRITLSSEDDDAIFPAACARSV
jgi:hypothetical protein